MTYDSAPSRRHYPFFLLKTSEPRTHPHGVSCPDAQFFPISPSPRLFSYTIHTQNPSLLLTLQKSQQQVMKKSWKRPPVDTRAEAKKRERYFGTRFWIINWPAFLVCVEIDIWGLKTNFTSSSTVSPAHRGHMTDDRRQTHCNVVISETETPFPCNVLRIFLHLFLQRRRRFHLLLF